jgi:hypothetical protein
MEDIIEEAKWVILMFDQANTNGVIEHIGSRGQLLKEAVEDLRVAMTRQGIDPGETRNPGEWMEGWTNSMPDSL